MNCQTHNGKHRISKRKSKASIVCKKCSPSFIMHWFIIASCSSDIAMVCTVDDEDLLTQQLLWWNMSFPSAAIAKWDSQHYCWSRGETNGQFREHLILHIWPRLFWRKKFLLYRRENFLSYETCGYLCIDWNIILSGCKMKRVDFS